MSSNPGQPQNKMCMPIGAASDPDISFGGSLANTSGNGIYGDDSSVNVAIAGTKIAAISSTGVAVTGTLSSSGAMNVVGDFSVATNKMTVAAASGNTAVAGSLAIGGGTAISKVLKGTVSVVIPALLTATQSDIEVTLTGVAAGNSIQVTPLDAAMEAGVAVVGAWYSTTNKIKIRIANLSGGTLTGSTSNFTYLVHQ